MLSLLLLINNTVYIYIYTFVQGCTYCGVFFNNRRARVDERPPHPLGCDESFTTSESLVMKESLSIRTKLESERFNRDNELRASRLLNHHVQKNWGAGLACTPHTPTQTREALSWARAQRRHQLACGCLRLRRFTLALRTRASGRNVGKVSFFAIKLSTREHSNMF